MVSASSPFTGLSRASSVKVVGASSRIPVLLDVGLEVGPRTTFEGESVTFATIEQERLAVEADRDSEALLLTSVGETLSGVFELKDNSRGVGSKLIVFFQKVHHIDNLGIVGRVDHEF